MLCSSSDVLLEIVRHCDYLRADADDIVITQGDDGDRSVTSCSRSMYMISLWLKIKLMVSLFTLNFGTSTL